MRLNPDPIVEINPAAASKVGIRGGDWVCIESPRGRIKQRERLTDGIRPEMVHAQHAWCFPENFRLGVQWANESCGPDATWKMAKKFAENIKQDLKEKGLEKEKLGVDKLDEPARLALQEAGIETVDAMPVLLEAMHWDPAVGRTKLEEMVVITDKGTEILTRMPIKDMMIASPITTA
ncbi:MAG: hypothetical protein JRJ85_06970 [Deltaproteobacteria bacterium]|nr:hypothetical protein [Deltaproteobacteria bacterium]